MAIDTNPVKIKEILERGVEEVIDKAHLETALKSGRKLRIKLGIDPTGPKIHIGRAIALWKLKAFQELGHQVVLIIGDFTAKIGDASDKTSQRKALTDKEIKWNMKGYKQQIAKILDIKKVEFTHNSEWLGKLKPEELLELAQQITAQQVIQRRNFKERWEGANPIGLHELFYPLLQGYDSVAIHADVELGGTDQLFNLNIGRDLQKFFKQKPQDILITKMLSGLDGRKMSTSWGNVISIVDTPNDMFGKIMSMQDELIGDYFELCTRLLPIDIEKIKRGAANPRDLKARLAKEIVTLYHGVKAAIEAEKEFDNVHRYKGLPSSSSFSSNTSSDARIFSTSKKLYPILDLLFESGLVSSKSEAKRMVLGKAVEINGVVKDNWQETIKLENNMVIQVGKRKFIKIKSLVGESER